jgi:hypothetical protein
MPGTQMPSMHAMPCMQSAGPVHGTAQRCVCMLHLCVPQFASLWHGGANGFGAAVCVGCGAG